MPNPNDVYGTSNGFNSLKRVFDSFYNGDDLADEYYAIVLETLPPKKTLDPANSSLWGLISGFEYSHEFFARTLAPVSAENSVFTPHDFLLNPCSPVDYEKIKETGITLQSVIRSHTKFVESSASPNPEAVVNSIIKVRFSHKIEQGKKVFNLKKGEFIGMATPSQIKAAQLGEPSAIGCNENSLIRLMKESISNGSGAPLAGGFVNLANTLTEPNIGERVESDSLSALTAIAEAELARWQGKKESDPALYSTLKKYWDNIGWAENQWTPGGVPWSAAFISFVMTSVDPGFPKSAAHYEYVKGSSQNKGGWTAWKASPGKFYKAEVGDIVVRPRQSSTNPNSSHGDVVYKIQSGVAYLAGGNVSNTAKTVGKLPIDGDGNYASFSSYIAILKKNGVVVPYSRSVS